MPQEYEPPQQSCEAGHNHGQWATGWPPIPLNNQTLGDTKPRFRSSTVGRQGVTSVWSPIYARQVGSTNTLPIACRICSRIDPMCVNFFTPDIKTFYLDKASTLAIVIAQGVTSSRRVMG